MSIDLLDRLTDDDEQNLLAIMRKQRPAGQSGPFQRMKEEAREESRRLAEGIYRLYAEGPQASMEGVCRMGCFVVRVLEEDR